MEQGDVNSLIISLKNCSLSQATVEVGPEALASKHAIRYGLEFVIDEQPTINFGESDAQFEQRKQLWSRELSTKVAQVRQSVCNTRMALLSHNVSIFHGRQLTVSLVCWMIPLKPEFPIEKGTLYLIKCEKTEIKWDQW